MNEKQIAYFGAGCFWGVEQKFKKTKGVIVTEVGYMGGATKNPTYEQVCSKKTGHAEVVRVEFDPLIISYDELIGIFFSIHDPTELNRQGPDVGSQYRSAIFYSTNTQKRIADRHVEKIKMEQKLHSPIATEISPASEFFRAEKHHQDYLGKKDLSSCHV